MLSRLNRHWSIPFILVSFLACGEVTEELPVEPEPDWHAAIHLDLPEDIPQPEFPDDNALTKGRVTLGKHLFFDKRLSRDNSISCGSCHVAEAAMADTVRFSLGVDGKIGLRNAPALFNLAWQPDFMRDGGIPTLEMQVLSPIGDTLEMDFNIVDAAERLKSDSFYTRLAAICYEREMEAYVITRAISAYERTLFSYNSTYDRHLSGETELSEAAMRGKQLFESDQTNCSSCHSGVHFTSYQMKNNGLYETYVDTGRARITLRSEDAGFFRVPTLRNVAYTAPYMHDGSLKTLEEVVNHYNNGGQSNALQDSLIRPLGLDEQQKADLVSFLEALSDTAFVKSEIIQPPTEIP